MQKKSPPKHRHDGTSPLPLGMDWSPPPKKWVGRNTVWPHNSQTGWSYCVMIPSWIVQPESGVSHDSFLKSIVFYRIHVGIQSPEGVSSSHGVLRRFSDFLKLSSDLMREFPKKDVPPAPPKHSFMRINSSRLLLEERRRTLEEWMGKLLSNIDLSRSSSVAAFLELEAAVRSSFQEWNQHPAVRTSVNANALASSFPTLESSSSVSFGDLDRVESKSYSVASDFDSDNAYETSDTGTPTKDKVRMSEASAEDVALIHDMNNGVLGELSVDQPDDQLSSNLNHRKQNLHVERDTDVGNVLTGASLHRERLGSTSEQEHDMLSGHARRNSVESIGSDVSSLRGSEISIPGITNSMGDGSTDPHAGVDTQIVLSLDQRQKLIRLLTTMQRRVTTTKTDMEDIIARLNQEMAVKEYLTTKVKDLEVELDTTKQKGKETLQQAILAERERITQIQWDMDELRRKYLEMESKLKFEQDEKTRVESEKTSASGERELLLQELEDKQEQLRSTQKHLEEVEMKSKADIKILVKEVKFLRNSQAELKKALSEYMEEKTELQRTLHNEKQRWAHASLARRKLLHECRILRDRLQECSVDFLVEEQDKLNVDSLSTDALDLLSTSDNRLGLLLAEAQLLAREDEQIISDAADTKLKSTDCENPTTADEEIRKMLTDMFIDNARLRKQLNSAMRSALNTVTRPEKEDDEEVCSRTTVLNRFLER